LGGNAFVRQPLLLPPQLDHLLSATPAQPFTLNNLTNDSAAVFACLQVPPSLLLSTYHWCVHQGSDQHRPQ
jgi:hypothetical protein